jgi:hypothetical protein
VTNLDRRIPTAGVLRSRRISHLGPADHNSASPVYRDDATVTANGYDWAEHGE